MMRRHVQFVDQSGTVLATGEVADEVGYYGGTIDLHLTPVPLRALFEEFEEIVNGQMFVFLDEIQEKIGLLPVKVLFDDGCEGCVKDLQVFPSTGDVSFRLTGVTSRTQRMT